MSITFAKVNQMWFTPSPNPGNANNNIFFCVPRRSMRTQTTFCDNEVIMCQRAFCSWFVSLDTGESIDSWLKLQIAHEKSQMNVMQNGRAKWNNVRRIYVEKKRREQKLTLRQIPKRSWHKSKCRNADAPASTNVSFVERIKSLFQLSCDRVPTSSRRFEVIPNFLCVEQHFTDRQRSSTTKKTRSWLSRHHRATPCAHFAGVRNIIECEWQECKK